MAITFQCYDFMLPLLYIVLLSKTLVALSVLSLSQYYCIEVLIACPAGGSHPFNFPLPCSPAAKQSTTRLHTQKPNSVLANLIREFSDKIMNVFILVENVQ